MGIRSPVVSSYLAYLVTVAEEGLPSDETRYLQPFKEILEYKRNVADLICAKARLIDPTIRGTISMGSAARVNLFVAELYRDNVDGGAHLIDMLSDGFD